MSLKRYVVLFPKLQGTDFPEASVEVEVVLGLLQHAAGARRRLQVSTADGNSAGGSILERGGPEKARGLEPVAGLQGRGRGVFLLNLILTNSL